MNFSYSGNPATWWGQTEHTAASIVRTETERYLVELYCPANDKHAGYIKTGESSVFIGLQNAIDWARAKDSILSGWAILAKIEVSESALAQLEEQREAETTLWSEDVAKIIAEYESIVRSNDAVLAVANDKDGEVIFEVWDVARDLGYSLSDRDHDVLEGAAQALKERLGAEIDSLISE
jgi:hypothetical protein